MSIDSVINEAILNSKNKEEIVSLEKGEKALKTEWLENARKRKEKEQELFKIFDDELCQKLKNNLKDKDVDIQDKENVLNVYKNEIKIICVDFNKRKISRSSGKEVFEFCFFYKNIPGSAPADTPDTVHPYWFTPRIITVFPYIITLECPDGFISLSSPSALLSPLPVSSVPL